MAKAMFKGETIQTVYILYNSEFEEAENHAYELDKYITTERMKVVFPAKDISYGSNEISGCAELMSEATWIVVLYNDKPENPLFEYQHVIAVSTAVYNRCANIVYILPIDSQEGQFVAFPKVRQEEHWIQNVKHHVSTPPEPLNLNKLQIGAPKEWLFRKFLTTGGTHFSSPARLRNNPGQLSRPYGSDSFKRMYVDEVYNDNAKPDFQSELPELSQEQCGLPKVQRELAELHSEIPKEEQGLLPEVRRERLEAECELPQQGVGSHEVHGSQQESLLSNTSIVDKGSKCIPLFVTCYLLLLVAVGFYEYSICL